MLIFFKKNCNHVGDGSKTLLSFKREKQITVDALVHQVRYVKKLHVGCGNFTLYIFIGMFVLICLASDSSFIDSWMFSQE